MTSLWCLESYEDLIMAQRAAMVLSIHDLPDRLPATRPLWGLLLHSGPSPALVPFLRLSPLPVHSLPNCLSPPLAKLHLSEVLNDCPTLRPPLAFLVFSVLHFFLTTLFVHFQHTYISIHVSSVGSGIWVSCTDVSQAPRNTWHRAGIQHLSGMNEWEGEREWEYMNHQPRVDSFHLRFC